MRLPSSFPRRTRLAALVVAAFVLLSGPIANSGSAVSAEQAEQGVPYTNPLKDDGGADPWLTYHDGAYYLITTSFSNEFTMRTASTLAGLTTAPDVQVWTDDTDSRGANFWAPEIHFVNGHWYLYYSAAQVDAPCCDTQRTHVLESAGTDPMGPYEYRGQLHPDWLIDVGVVQLNDQLYMLGSRWTEGTQNIVIAPMSDPYTRSGELSTISRPTYDWETQGSPVNEGPVALHHDGDTFIAFSASYCATPDYKLGLLRYTGGDPLDAASWTKLAEPAFQRADANGVYGPGHNGFFTSPDGTENWIVYHANDSVDEGCDNGRTTRAQKFTWNADGTPSFGTPVRLGESLPGPSGESR